MNTRKRYVLVTDDEPDIRYLLRSILERGGHEVAEAGNGAEALESARKRRPDLILLDLKMPVMDGFTCLEQLKADPGLKDIPVVVVTAWGELLEGEPAMAMAEAYIGKPFTPASLVGVVEDVLTRPRS